MAETWLIRVYNDHVLATFKECAGPVELGRQNQPTGEELNQIIALADGGYRIVIAPGDDVKISRRHARVEEIAPGRVLVRNFSNNNAIVFEDGYQLRPERDREADLPVVLRIGSRVVRIKPTGIEPEEFAIQSLDEPTAAPGSDAGWVGTSTISLNSAGTLEARGVFDWLKAMIRVLHSAACDTDFFQKAAQAVVEVVGLDMGRVLIRDGDGWQSAAFHPGREAEYERNNPPSRSVLDRVCRTKIPSWIDPSKMLDPGSSVAGMASVVAAPCSPDRGR